MAKIYKILKILLLLCILQACSGNSFHLRKNTKLPDPYQTVALQGLPAETKFKTFFDDALAEAGGAVLTNNKQATTLINFSRFEEGRRVIAYTSERRAREYLVFLKIEYSLQNKNKLLLEGSKQKRRRINIDRSYLYDPDFALGKAEEERQVKNALYKEAARLILLRLKYRGK